MSQFLKYLSFARMADTTWSCLKKSDPAFMSKDDFLNALCFHLVYALADSHIWTSTASESHRCTHLLNFLLPASQEDRFECAKKKAAIGGYSLAPVKRDQDTKSSCCHSNVPDSAVDIRFAIPRLISRICEIQNNHTKHHPLIRCQRK